jgi:putative transposase
VKYRKKVFQDDLMISDLKTIINTIAKDFEVEIIEQQCGDDHLHLLFKAKPTLDICKFINILKGRSSRMLRDKYKDFLKDKLWGDSFWSPSYFLATSGNVTIDILKKYVSDQRLEQE